MNSIILSAAIAAVVLGILVKRLLRHSLPAHSDPSASQNTLVDHIINTTRSAERNIKHR